MKYRILSCMVLMFFFMACNEEEEIQMWIQKIEQFKINVQEERDHAPYGQKQQEAFKAYFSEINQMVVTLKKEEKYVKPFNTVIEKNDLATLCSKALLLKEEWQGIMRHCTRNRFFLCSEEVRSYPEMLSALRSYLRTKNKNKFDTIPACKDSL